MQQVTPPSAAENGAARASLELLYHVSRELAAAIDLPTVLKRVLSLCMQNVGAINGSIIVLDERGRPIESAIAISGTMHERTTEQLAVTLEHGLAGWVVRNKKAALVSNTAEDERWFRRPDDAVDRTGNKSVVSAPILARDLLTGVITLVHPVPHYFTEDHLSLLKAIADQAGIAVLNARLYAESQTRARVMTAIAQSAAAINASLQIEDVLERILEQTQQALQVEVVSLALLDPGTEELVFRASTYQGEPGIVGVRFPVGEGIAGWVARKGFGTVAQDAYEDKRFSPFFDNLTGFYTTAVACAPIVLRDEVIGIIEALNPKDNYFGGEAVLVLSGVASLAGSAIHHAQTFEQLQAAHQRYRELFEDNIDPILVTDREGRIVEANRQAEMMTGRDRGELRQLRIDNLVAEEDLRFPTLSRGETVSYETEISAEACTISVQVYAKHVDIEGAPYIQWILHDITERKNLDALRDDLISMIYHDLRSPLANIVSSLDVIDSLLEDKTETLQSLLKIATRSTERIQRLTSSLLDINRLEAGQDVADKRPADMKALLEDAVDAVGSAAVSKNVTIRKEVTLDLLPVVADTDMIRRVLINLLDNAVRFSPSGSEVRLGSRVEGEYVLTWVTDSGPGIPPYEHDRIFNKYARISTAQFGRGGLGLGLAFCRLAVNAHGGKIWVESEPSKGAAFLFTLPLVFKSDIEK